MGNLTRHPWAFAGAGLALHFGWVVIGGLVFDDTPGREPGLAVAAAELPLLIGSGMAFAGGIAGRRRAQARGQRVAFATVAIAASLQAITVVWDWVNELHGSEDTTYIAPWIVALLLLPVAFATALRGRGFRRGPEAVREPLLKRLRRGWREATRSWTLLVRSGRLLLLPAAAYVFGCGTWIGAFVLAGHVADATMSRLVVTSFIGLLPGTLVGTFFGVAYLSALDRQLSGRPATVGGGLGHAWARRRAIFGWSLLAAGVGAVLQALQQLRAEWAAGPLLSWVAGAAWGVLTLFVLPVLAVEDLGLRDTLRRAGALVRRRWGEGIAGVSNLTLVAVAASVVVCTLLVVGTAVAAPSGTASDAVFVAALAASVLIIVAIGSAMQVLALALYRHAAGAGPVAPFTDDDLQHALVARRRWLRRRD
jgi:hypothetical protein